MPNILAIVGSRDFQDYDRLCEVISEWCSEHGSIDGIVSGGCKGADTLAERYAADNKIPMEIHPPDWIRHGSRAGPVRNQKIVDSATHMIAFPSRNGRGTQDSIRKAEKKGIAIQIIWIDSSDQATKP